MSAEALQCTLHIHNQSYLHKSVLHRKTIIRGRCNLFQRIFIALDMISIGSDNIVTKDISRIGGKSELV